MSNVPAGMCVVVSLSAEEYRRAMWEGYCEGVQCNDERVRGSWYCARHKEQRRLVCENTP